MEADVDLMDIARPAAIKLARSTEQPLSLVEVQQPVRKSQSRNGQTLLRRPGMIPADANPRPNRSEPGDYIPQGNRMDKPREEGMVRLRMNLGKQHGIRPGDVVGAIASETGIPGKAIGSISIHDKHTLVDVAEMHVKKVLKASTGQYQLRGKPITLTLEH